MRSKEGAEGIWHAVIFDRNIMYSFRAENLGTINKLDTFKEFLDTLKY